MRQEATGSTAAKNSAPNVLSRSAIDSLLAAHVIELELRGAAPRRVRRLKPVKAPSGYVELLFVVLLPLILFGISRPILFLVLIYPIFHCVLALSSKQRNKHRFLLSRGIALPAVVTEISKVKDDTQHRVTFAYPTADSPCIMDSVLLTQSEIAQHDLIPGKSFTLLAHPEAPGKVLPYFLIDIYAVTTAPPMTKAGTSIVGADPNAEAELRCPLPRPVTWSKQTTKNRIWMANCLAAIAAFAFFLWQDRSSDFGFVFSVLTLGIAVIGFVACIPGEVEAHRARFFLRHGYADVVTIDQCMEEDGILVARYTFTGNRGAQEQGFISIPVHRAAELGDIQKGTRFTVLRHPGDSLTVLPYYLATGATIRGSGAARFLSAPLPSSVGTQSGASNRICSRI